MAPDGTKLNREQARKFLLERFKSHFEPPNVESDDPFDLQSAISDDAPGRPREAWHMTEFAKVDDFIEDGYTKTEACRRVRKQLPPELSYWGDDRSFRNIYYEFKRKHEKFVRKRAFAYSVLNNNINEAVEQIFRLSKITNVHRPLSNW